MTSLPVILAALAPALAAPKHDTMDATLPSRPTTFVVDDHLTNSAAENFRELYVDPAALGKKLSPTKAITAPGVAGAPGIAAKNRPTASLPIINLASSYADVTVNGTKVGRIGPLTNGALHDMRSGVYDVSFKLQNGYELTKQVQTVSLDGPIVPGGEGARASLEEGWVPLWSDAPLKGWVEPPPPPKPKKKKRVRLVGKRIEFDGKVMFDTGSSTILEESNTLLDDMATVLVENTKVVLVEVQGHTDARGKRSGNVKLSQSRAEAVVAYLVGKGVEAARLQAKGLGPDAPVMEGETEEAWAANRRVELHVLKQKSAAVIQVSPKGPATREAQGEDKAGAAKPATREAQGEDKAGAAKPATGEDKVEDKAGAETGAGE